MKAIRLTNAAVLAAVVAVFSGGLDRAEADAGAVVALSYRTPKPLSPWDAQIYAAAFEAAQHGDFAAAAAQAERVTDKALIGHLEQRRLLSGRSGAGFAELSAWLERHADLGGADRIFALAKKRQPEGAPEPRPPVFSASRNWSHLEASGAPAQRSADRGQAARELFYKGDVKGAYDAAVAVNERWIAGLAAFRLKNYGEALGRFEAVARDPRQDEWQRAGAGYWAARAAIASGSPELAPEFLRIAAAHPTTFYGLIAERQLGLEPAAREVAPHDPIGAQLIRASYEGQMDLDSLVRDDVRARRAAALAQIGELGEASVELRGALAASRTEAERRQWIALATALRAPLATLQASLDTDDYPTPVLSPRGGFTLDPALVYAIVRQESRFNPAARSHAGATGLMQLMPATAAWMTGDDRLKTDTSSLSDPAANLRLGQDYFTHLLRQGAVDDCILRALAAYNGGPGTLLRTSKSLGDDTDALMLIESLPYAETRNYVERVMAGYWIYRQMFGSDSKTLDAVASGATTIDGRLDLSRQANSAAPSSMSMRASR